MKKTVRPYHYVIFWVVKFLCFIYTRLFLGFRSKRGYRIKKGERIIFMSNHQTDLDPLCLFTLFNKPVFPVATDNIFAGRFMGRFLSWLGVIPKKKGAVDIKTTVKMASLLKEGGSLFVFPEGNRTYAEFQYYMAPTLAKFVKRSGATLVLYTLHGGTGIFPRFAKKKRRGRFYGEIARVISPEEYANIPDEELMEIIRTTLRVYDSESGEKFTSSARAEYMERMFFVCPVCGGMQTVYSKKHDVYCKNCGRLAEYTEDLRLAPARKDFTFTRLVDWWDHQKKAMREMLVNVGNTAFFDEDVKIFLSDPFKKKKLLGKGKLSLTDKTLSCGDLALEIGGISSQSVISGRKLSFSLDGHDYLIVGNQRFNPLKYAFAFNKFGTKMRDGGSDKYFNLEDETYA